MKLNRRTFLAAGAAAVSSMATAAPARKKKQLKLGLVTYNWGKNQGNCI